MSKKSSNTTTQNTTSVNQSLGDFTNYADFSYLLGGNTIVMDGSIDNRKNVSFTASNSFENAQSPKQTTTNTTTQKDEASAAASVGVGVGGGSGSGGSATLDKQGDSLMASGGGTTGTSLDGSSLIYIAIAGVIGVIAFFILRKK